MDREELIAVQSQQMLEARPAETVSSSSLAVASPITTGQESKKIDDRGHISTNDSSCLGFGTSAQIALA